MAEIRSQSSLLMDMTPTSNLHNAILLEGVAVLSTNGHNSYVILKLVEEKKKVAVLSTNGHDSYNCGEETHEEVAEGRSPLY